MTATPNDVRFANDVCLTAHFMANIASLRNEVEQHHICEANASYRRRRSFVFLQSCKPQCAYLSHRRAGNFSSVNTTKLPAVHNATTSTKTKGVLVAENNLCNSKLTPAMVGMWVV